MDEWKFLETASIFQMFNPVEIVTRGRAFAFSTSLVFNLAATSILLAWVAFTRREVQEGADRSWINEKSNRNSKSNACNRLRSLKLFRYGIEKS